jgi:ParB family chromosome partitioning protein
MSGAELDHLIESIRSRGLLLPPRVRPADPKSGKLTIVSGHRRIAAIQKLGWTQVDCILVEGQFDDAAILEEQLAENLFRENLSPIEEAKAIQRFITLKSCTATEATKLLHLSNARISRALKLLELPEELQDRVHRAQLAPETAYHLGRLPEGQERQKLTEQALAGQLGRDTAARAARNSNSTKRDKGGLSRVSCLLEEGRTLTVSAESVQIDSLIETLEEVLREARKARSQGWDVSTLAKVFKDRAGKITK